MDQPQAMQVNMMELLGQNSVRIFALEKQIQALSQHNASLKQQLDKEIFKNKANTPPDHLPLLDESPGAIPEGIFHRPAGAPVRVIDRLISDAATAG